MMTSGIKFYKLRRQSCFNDISETRNSIIVVPSANNYVTSDYALEALSQAQAGDIVLIQQEIPAKQ